MVTKEIFFTGVEIIRFLGGGRQEIELAAKCRLHGRRAREVLWKPMELELEEHAGEREREQVRTQEVRFVDGTTPCLADATAHCEPARQQPV